MFEKILALIGIIFTVVWIIFNTVGISEEIDANLVRFFQGVSVGNTCSSMHY